MEKDNVHWESDAIELIDELKASFDAELSRIADDLATEEGRTVGRRHVYAAIDVILGSRPDWIYT